MIYKDDHPDLVEKGQRAISLFFRTKIPEPWKYTHVSLLVHKSLIKKKFASYQNYSYEDSITAKILNPNEWYVIEMTDQENVVKYSMNKCRWHSEFGGNSIWVSRTEYFAPNFNLADYVNYSYSPYFEGVLRAIAGYPNSKHMVCSTMCAKILDDAGYGNSFYTKWYRMIPMFFLDFTEFVPINSLFKILNSGPKFDYKNQFSEKEEEKS